MVMVMDDGLQLANRTDGRNYNCLIDQLLARLFVLMYIVSGTRTRHGGATIGRGGQRHVVESFS
jgi:hypothetical protein